MKSTVKTLSLLFFTLALTISNTYAHDNVLIEAEEIEVAERDYTEIVREIFPEYQSDSQISPQWTSGDMDTANPGTHGYITQVAFNLLRSDNSSAYSFYNGQRTNLIRGAVLPDKDETSLGTYAWHFYGSNGYSWNGSTNTAYVKCIEHYNNAIDLYNSGDKASAMETLGRALHYLQDVNVPQHAMNMTVLNVSAKHSQFESEAENNMESYAVTRLTNYEYTDADSSLGTIIDSYAETARSWYDKASSDTASERAQAAGSCVRNAQRATATVLYKFMIEVS